MDLPAGEALTFDARSTDLGLVAGRGLLVGWAFSETTTVAVARLKLRDGEAAGAPLLVPITLSADQSTRDYLPGAGIRYYRGIFLDMTAGTVDGGVVVIREEQMPRNLAAYLFGNAPYPAALVGGGE